MTRTKPLNINRARSATQLSLTRQMKMTEKHGGCTFDGWGAWGIQWQSIQPPLVHTQICLTHWNSVDLCASKASIELKQEDCCCGSAAWNFQNLTKHNWLTNCKTIINIMLKFKFVTTLRRLRPATNTLMLTTYKWLQTWTLLQSQPICAICTILIISLYTKFKLLHTNICSNFTINTGAISFMVLLAIQLEQVSMC